MRVLLTVLGFLSLGLATLGVFLPVLPTTPFLLLSAALFLRGNRHWYEWLMNHPKFGPYITNFTVHKAIPLRVKIVSVSLVWITLLNCAIFVAEQNSHIGSVRCGYNCAGDYPANQAGLYHPAR